MNDERDQILLAVAVQKILDSLSMANKKAITVKATYKWVEAGYEHNRGEWVPDIQIYTEQKRCSNCGEPLLGTCQ